MDALICDNCGGKDFYKESGYYYCSECQIQSQEVQEQVFQVEESGINKKSTRKLQEKKKSKEEHKITSWECYNYVMRGLTEELIVLGAKPEIKEIVKILWLKYLVKLEVFKIDSDEIPKLQVVGSKIDAEIIYGVKHKRRRGGSSTKSSSLGSSSNECDTTTLDSSSIKRERAKKKRALMQAHYDKYNEATTSGTPSTHTETLQSIQGSSEKAAVAKPPITYNIYAAKSLHQKLTKYHVKRHRHDMKNELDCHSLGTKHLTREFLSSVYYISIDKIYSILYLALLIVQDKIQLGDMLRFIEEGKLSFNYYSHIFPEDYNDKLLNFCKKSKSKIFNHEDIREKTAKMAVALKVTRFIPEQDLCELCKRFCKDLNLPDEIAELANKIILRSQMKMSFTKRRIIPNYEGRVLCVILFTLKFLFGLDGITENKLSNFAEILNRSSAIQPKMFSFEKWIKYIEYRQTKLNDYNTNFSKNTVPTNLRNFYRNLLIHKIPERKVRRSVTTVKEVVEQIEPHLKGFQPMEFETTFTPSVDYIKKIVQEEEYYDSFEIFNQNFTENSLNFILQPLSFLEVIKSISSVEIKNGGANEFWKLETLLDLCQEWRKKIKDDDEDTVVKPVLGKPKPCIESTDKQVNNGELLLQNFDECNMSNFHYFKKRLKKFSSKGLKYEFEVLHQDLLDENWEYPEHFIPCQRYWLRGYLSTYLITQTMCDEYLKEAPDRFRIIFEDLIRIGHQHSVDFLRIFIRTELFLVFHFLPKFCSNSRARIPKNKSLERFLENYQIYW